MGGSRVSLEEGGDGSKRAYSCKNLFPPLVNCALCTDDTTESSAIKRAASNFRSVRTNIDTGSFLSAEGLQRSSLLSQGTARERREFPFLRGNLLFKINVEVGFDLMMKY